MTDCQMACMVMLHAWSRTWMILLSTFGIIPYFSYTCTVLLLELFYTSVHIQWTQCILVDKTIWQNVKFYSLLNELEQPSTVKNVSVNLCDAFI